MCYGTSFGLWTGRATPCCCCETGGFKSVEGQLAESFIDPNVQPEARDRVIRALMSWYVDKGRTEKVDHWRKYLSEMEDP